MFINELKRFLIFCFVRKFSPFMPLLRKIFSTCYIIFILIRKWIKLQTVPKLSLFDNENSSAKFFVMRNDFSAFGGRRSIEVQVLSVLLNGNNVRSIPDRFQRRVMGNKVL